MNAFANADRADKADKPDAMADPAHCRAASAGADVRRDEPVGVTASPPEGDAPARTSDALTIRLDDRTLQVAAGTTLAALLADLSLSPTAVATALNGRFVPRDQRGQTALGDGDQVLLFQPIVGG